MNSPTHNIRFNYRGVHHRIVRWRGHSAEYVQANYTGQWSTVASFTGTPTESNARRALAKAGR